MFLQACTNRIEELLQFQFPAVVLCLGKVKLMSICDSFLPVASMRGRKCVTLLTDKDTLPKVKHIKHTKSNLWVAGVAQTGQLKR